MNNHPDVSQAKAELRRTIRARRRERPAGDQQRLAAGLAAVATGRPELRAARAVTAYVALPGEPDTGQLQAWLAARGVTVWLPVVTTFGPADEPGLSWALAADGLAPGASTPTGLRILEPTGPRQDSIRADVVLLPGLAVDHEGIRLGQGAGYYDRTIARLGWGARPAGPPAPAPNPGPAPAPALAPSPSPSPGLGPGPGPGATNPLLVAIVHDDEVLETVPGEPHDVRAHVICTPTRWIPVR